MKSALGGTCIDFFVDRKFSVNSISSDFKNTNTPYWAARFSLSLHFVKKVKSLEKFRGFLL
jgi:hypothetical protein